MKIDPLILKVQYLSNRRRNPYFTFGLSTGSIRTKIIQSKIININVNPIPVKGRSENFTGLVGDHEFKISLNKRKFLVNEAIELKIEVEGKGALENYDAPVIYKNDNLEEFDQKGKIIHLNTISAKKVFDYTFLPRGPLKIEARKIKFHFFDPATKRFKENILSIPELIVGGKAVSPSSPSLVDTNTEGLNDPVKNNSILESKKSGALIAPIFRSGFTDKNWIPKLNIIIIIVIIALMGEFIFSYFKKKSDEESLNQLCMGIRKDGLNYSKLHKIIMNLRPSKNHSYDISLSSIIDKSSLSKKAKIYFKDLIEKSEKATFKEQNMARDFMYQESFFDELKSHL